MKTNLVLVITLLFSTTLFAQNNVTEFLGIPIDGTKSEMIQKLKQKGFSYDYNTGYMKGEFNAREVFVAISTYHNKVWCIGVLYNLTPEYSKIVIKKQFNTLVNQFDKTTKYIDRISLDTLAATNSNYKPSYVIGEFEDIPEQGKTIWYYQKNELDIHEAHKKLEQGLKEHNKEGESEAVKRMIYARLLRQQIKHKVVMLCLDKTKGKEEYGILIMYINDINAPIDGEDL